MVTPLKDVETCLPSGRLSDTTKFRHVFTFAHDIASRSSYCAIFGRTVVHGSPRYVREIVTARIDVSISALPVYQDGETHQNNGPPPRCRCSYKDSRASCEKCCRQFQVIVRPSSADDDLPVVQVDLGEWSVMLGVPVSLNVAGVVQWKKTRHDKAYLRSS